MSITKTLAGKQIKCKFCESPIAWISLEDQRYKVNCPTCQSTYYLKNQHEK